MLTTIFFGITFNLLLPLDHPCSQNLHACGSFHEEYSLAVVENYSYSVMHAVIFVLCPRFYYCLHNNQTRNFANDLAPD